MLHKYECSIFSSALVIMKGFFSVLGMVGWGYLGLVNHSTKTIPLITHPAIHHIRMMNVAVIIKSCCDLSMPAL